MLASKYWCFLLLLWSGSFVSNNNNIFVLGRDFDYEERAEIASSAGLSVFTYQLKSFDWEIQPLKDMKNTIKDKQLRKHLEKYLTKEGPIQFKLSTLTGKDQKYKAVAKTTKGGTRLRAVWGQSVDPDQLVANKQLDITKESYDDFLRGTTSGVEMELLLPPLQKKGKLISVVYETHFGGGTLDPKSVAPVMKSDVNVYPNGRSKDAKSIFAGRTDVGLPARNGMVDPSWAKGRGVFKKGRYCGDI